MKKFKHSGTFGDILYSLPIVKYLGGGEFYLHLNQVDWIAKHYYNSDPAPYQKGKMDESDLEFMRDFFLAQDYISKVEALDPQTTEITHNLDKFRPMFVGHPTHYINIYCQVFNIMDIDERKKIIETPWLTVPNPKSIPDRPYVVNRTSRGFTGSELNSNWTEWKKQGIDKQSIFVGLEQEYRDFCQLTGWELDYYPVKTMLEMAELIAGCEQYIGNQSAALAIAQGLRVPYAFEARVDLPLERNECNFGHENGDIF